MVQPEVQSKRVSPPMILPEVPGSRGRMAQRTKIESNTTGEKVNAMMSNDILLYS